MIDKDKDEKWLKSILSDIEDALLGLGDLEEITRETALVRTKLEEAKLWLKYDLSLRTAYLDKLED